MSTQCRNLKHCVDLHTHVHPVFSRITYSKFSRNVPPKTIFSGNGNGLKSFTFLSTREQKNVHTVYIKQDCVCVGGGGGGRTHIFRGKFTDTKLK